jgi:uncharacterized protein YutE (UPF0331/DUF86 family)
VAFRVDLTRQESVLLNLQRATEAAIDLATALRGMVGFRNVAVRDDRKLDLDVVEAIVERHLDDLLAFARLALRARGAE